MIAFPKIIVDESTDARIIDALEETGYDVLSIQRTTPGITDIDIIILAQKWNGYILTEDKDFGDEIVFRKISETGALLLRLAGVSIEDKIRLVLTAIEKHSSELQHAFSVLTKNKLRIRKMNL